jgi:hypothetical protein
LHSAVVVARAYSLQSGSALPLFILVLLMNLLVLVMGYPTSCTGVVIKLRVLCLFCFIKVLVLISIENLRLGRHNCRMLSHIFQGVDLVRIIGNDALSEEVVSQGEEGGISIGPDWGLEVWI